MPDHDATTTDGDTGPGGDPPARSWKRLEVVRRLRARGVSDRTISTLLPDWRHLLEQARQRRGPRGRAS